MQTPLISVIMPVYNAEKYLASAIESILNQSYPHFEFLIFNDGSTDNSSFIIQTYQDDRIAYFRSEVNEGYVYHLNKGMAIAKGKYIARMDADDIAAPKRFEKSVDFLESNPTYAMVGSAVRYVYNDSDVASHIGYRTSYEYNTIRLRSIFYSPFVHPSIMIRTTVLREFGYSKEHYIAEDFHLWVRILDQYQATNLPEPLLYYRMHETNVSNVQKATQLDSLRKIYQLRFDQEGIFYTEKDVETHLLVPASNPVALTLEQMIAVEKWLIFLKKEISSNHRYTKKEINSIFAEVWYRVIERGRMNGWKAYEMYKKSRLSKLQKSSFLLDLRLLLVCLERYPLVKNFTASINHLTKSKYIKVRKF